MCICFIQRKENNSSSDRISTRAPILQNERERSQEEKRDFVSICFSNTGIDFCYTISSSGRINIIDDIELNHKIVQQIRFS
jgi:hypothetical protein